MKQMKVILAGVAIASIALTAGADVLVNWDFSGLDFIGDVAIVDEATVTSPILVTADGNALAGSSVSDLTADGVNLRYSALAAANTVTGEADLKNWGNGTGYIEFTLTADAGQTINITDIDLSAYRNGGGAPANFKFDVNLDGAGFVQFGATYAAPTPGAGNYDASTYTGDITTLDGGNAVIRFAPFNSTGNVHINDLQVTGSITAIPEPATLGLVAVFGGGVLLIRRRLMI